MEINTSCLLSVPVATYRLQLNGDYGFDAARQLLRRHGCRARARNHGANGLRERQHLEDAGGPREPGVPTVRTARSLPGRHTFIGTRNQVRERRLLIYRAVRAVRF